MSQLQCILCMERMYPGLASTMFTLETFYNSVSWFIILTYVEIGTFNGFLVP